MPCLEINFIQMRKTRDEGPVSQRRKGSRGIRFQFARGVLHDLNGIRQEIRHSKRKRSRDPAHSLKDLALTFAMSKKYSRRRRPECRREPNGNMRRLARATLIETIGQIPLRNVLSLSWRSNE